MDFDFAPPPLSTVWYDPICAANHCINFSQIAARYDQQQLFILKTVLLMLINWTQSQKLSLKFFKFFALNIKAMILKKNYALW